MKCLTFFVLNIFSLFLLHAAPLSFPNIQTKEDIISLFPKNFLEMQAYTQTTLEEVQQACLELRTMDTQKVSYLTQLEKVDQIIAYLQQRSQVAQTLSLVVPEKDLRNQSEKSYLLIESTLTQFFADEHQIYLNLKKGLEKNKGQLDETQQYLSELILNRFELSGHSLSQEERQKIAELNKDITELEAIFQKNINEDNRFFYASEKSLSGIHKETLSRFEQNELGQYRIGCDYPTYASVMTLCDVADTRQKLNYNMNNLAFPKNEEVLNDLIKKRDELATTLGYQSFAHLSLSQEMAKDPKVVSGFLKDLWSKSKPKEEKEFKALSLNLPTNIKLTKEGKIRSWDSIYSRNYYKKKHYNIDNEQIAEYFPLQSTVDGLITLYESFFDIQISSEPIQGLWDPNLMLLKVSEKDNTLIGYVLFDIFPRDNKYTHACDCPGLALGLIKEDHTTPTLEVVIANLTKPTESRPSLLKHREVETFFHEFGHAIHSLFAKSEYASLSSINSPFMKYDFVELPSQMLEEWMWDPEVLKKISCHYKTKKPLPDSQIEKLVLSKNMASGGFIQSQCYLSFLSLNYFSEGANKNVDQIARDLRKHLLPHYEDLENVHRHLSFGHLTEYGPRYYGYLWSKVFALDLFAQIKKEGLMNPKIGNFYRKTILEKGASVDPNILVRNFLGREPNQEAFLEDLEIKPIENKQELFPL